MPKYESGPEFPDGMGFSAHGKEDPCHSPDTEAAREEREPALALKDTREKLAHARALEKTPRKKYIIFGKRAEQDPETAQEMAQYETEYKEALREYRNTLLEQGEDPETVVTKTVAQEATQFYEEKTKAKAEQESNTWKKPLEKIQQFGNWYNRQHWAAKIGLSGLLLGAAAGGAVYGGAAGTTIATTAFLTKGAQRWAAALGVGTMLEATIKGAQQRKEQKEVKKEIPTEQLGEHIKKLSEEDSEHMDKKLFELEGKKRRRKYSRFALSGTAAALIGSGVVGEVIANTFFEGWRESALDRTETNIDEETARHKALDRTQTNLEKEIAHKEGVAHTEANIEKEAAHREGVAYTEANIRAEAAAGSEQDSEIFSSSFEGSDSEPGSAEAPAEESSGSAQEMTPTEQQALETARGIEALAAENAEYTVESGDNLWKVIESKLADNDLLKNMNEAQRTHLIDALKDRFAECTPEQLKEMGIGSGDIDELKAGETIDLSYVLSDEEYISNAVSNAYDLSDAQTQNILENNQVLEEWVNNHPDEQLTTERTEEILGNETPSEEAETSSAETASETPAESIDYTPTQEELKAMRTTGLSPAEYGAIRETNLAEFLKQIPAGTEEVCVVKDTGEVVQHINGKEITLGHEGTYEASEFERQNNLAKYIRAWMDKVGFTRPGDVTVHQFVENHTNLTGSHR